MHKRIIREKKVLEKMIDLYCKENHKKDSLCTGCINLKNYALKRLIHCPFEKDKPVCSKCNIHCYNSSKREEIKNVMKFSGPKMLFKYPKDTMLYFYSKIRYKNQKIQ